MMRFWNPLALGPESIALSLSSTFNNLSKNAFDARQLYNGISSEI
jgi:hypothetical protein